MVRYAISLYWTLTFDSISSLQSATPSQSWYDKFYKVHNFLMIWVTLRVFQRIYLIGFANDFSKERQYKGWIKRWITEYFYLKFMFLPLNCVCKIIYFYREKNFVIFIHHNWLPFYLNILFIEILPLVDFELEDDIR